MIGPPETAPTTLLPDPAALVAKPFPKSPATPRVIFRRCPGGPKGFSSRDPNRVHVVFLCHLPKTTTPQNRLDSRVPHGGSTLLDHPFDRQDTAMGLDHGQDRLVANMACSQDLDRAAIEIQPGAPRVGRAGIEPKDDHAVSPGIFSGSRALVNEGRKPLWVNQRPSTAWISPVSCSRSSFVLMSHPSAWSPA